MKRPLRLALYGTATLAGLLAFAFGLVFGFSEARIRQAYAVEPAAVALTSDPETIERGRHVATIRGCLDCHTATLGGQVFLDEPMVGRLFASNLTSGAGGVGASYTDRDWLRAIRHGIGPDGRSLLFMPSYEYAGLSDDDTRALIAYLKSRPPVDNLPVSNRVGPVGRVLLLRGDLPLLPAELIDHDAAPAAAPAPGATREYGAYLITGCVGCHGPTLSGGRIPGTPPGFPPAANITPDPETGIGGWSEADFIRALRAGVRPDGRALRPEMPSKLYAEMTDDEARALWLHVSTVPAKEYGGR